MQKVAVIAHASAREDLIEALHREGAMELSETKHPVPVDHTEVNFRSAELTFAIDILKNFASKETQKAVEKPTTFDQVLFATQHTDTRGIIDELHRLEEEDTEAEHHRREAQILAQKLEPWTALSCPLSVPRSTQWTVRIFGTLAVERLPALRSLLSAELPRTELEEIQQSSNLFSLVAHVWKEDVERFMQIATTEGWTDVELPSLDAPPRVLHEQALMGVKEMESIRRRNTEARARLSVELPNLVKVRQFLHWLDEKQSAREAMSPTMDTVTLLGWIPRDSLVLLEDRLHRVSPAIAVLKVKPDEGEDAPVLLKNPRFATPFESVTNLYGLPLYGESDPTLALLPFFALYFALCLTDSGYGAVLAIVFGTVLWKTKKSIAEARLLWLLFLVGILTFFVSIPFGGWFGLAPEQVPSFLTKTTADGSLFFRGQVWNLNTQSGITFLQNLSLILGITHLFFGMFLAGYHKWIHGKKAEALWTNFTPHLLLGSVLFLVFAPAEMKDTARYVLYGAVALLVWGKGYGTKWFLRPIIGALGVMNLSIGLLSNSLSYLRILALGLVTGAIAMAVNQVAVEMGKLFPVWIGVPVIVVIFLGGHLVSIALNTLGSFIHSGRLQFIEFFSQFFEGGGRPFSPFRRSVRL